MLSTKLEGRLLRTFAMSLVSKVVGWEGGKRLTPKLPSKLRRDKEGREFTRAAPTVLSPCAQTTTSIHHFSMR